MPMRSIFWGEIKICWHTLIYIWNASFFWSNEKKRSGCKDSCITWSTGPVTRSLLSPITFTVELLICILSQIWTYIYVRINVLSKLMLHFVCCRNRKTETMIIMASFQEKNEGWINIREKRNERRDSRPKIPRFPFELRYVSDREIRQAQQSSMQSCLP